MRKFVRIDCIRQVPGNPRQEMFVRADTIVSFGEAAPEYAQTGGVSFIDIGQFGNDRMITGNEVQDIADQISKAEM